jgi:hypothetical protein
LDKDSEKAQIFRKIELDWKDNERQRADMQRTRNVKSITKKSWQADDAIVMPTYGTFNKITRNRKKTTIVIAAVLSVSTNDNFLCYYKDE